MAIQNGFIQIIQDEKRDYQYEEAMKTLRTNIQFSGNGLKVIMLTSAMSDEGKSETSFQCYDLDGTDRGTRVIYRCGYP